jgi:hypothetical protein
MNIFKIALILIIGNTFLSCRKENSEEIDQSEIYADYRIIYKEDLNKTFARATFKHQLNTGENLKLGKDASILVNGVDMVWNSTFKRYEYDFLDLDTISTSNQFLNSFSFTDNDGAQFKNKLNFNKVAQYNKQTASNDSLYKDSIQFIPWDNADPLVSGEYVNLIMIQNNTIIELSNDTIGATGIFINSDSFDPFQLGDIEVHFEKWVDFPLHTNNAGGNGKSQTISKTKTVKLLN